MRRVGQQDHVVGPLLQQRHGLVQQLLGADHLQVVVGRQLLLVGLAENGRDADRLEAAVDQLRPRQHLFVESEEPHVAADEHRLGIGVGGHDLGKNLFGGQREVGQAQSGGAVAHGVHAVDGDLELDFSLLAEALGRAADVHADHRPAILGILAEHFEERVAAAHAAFHFFQSCAAARLQIALLLPGDEQRQFGSGPRRFARQVDEDGAVFPDRIERDLTLVGPRTGADRSGGVFWWLRPRRGCGRRGCGLGRSFSPRGNRQFGPQSRALRRGRLGRRLGRNGIAERRVLRAARRRRQVSVPQRVAPWRKRRRGGCAGAGGLQL